MRIFNSLTRKIEEFEPLDKDEVRMYSCGPTVYDTAHVGNFRTYVLHDVLHRTLDYLDYGVKFVSNITDVGHLVSDADEGEDKLEKGARREGKTAWNVAKMYARIFYSDEKKLNILPPDIRCRATDYIQEQIGLIRKLEEKGFTYKTSDGVYFDTSKDENYGALISLDRDSLKEGARVEKNPEKRNASDFALWKFAPENERRDMEWPSPWGKGFPGWHIECSAMSMKHLGEQFDIHVGGTDIKSTHHVNEIAQSEAATGKKPFAKYWVHGELLKVDGGRMGKSLGNAYNLEDIEKKDFEPLALRYLYLTAHYRSFLNFTWEALEGAQKALDRLKSITASWDEPRIGCAEFEERFAEAVSDDLDMPRAVSIVWELVKSDYPGHAKHQSLLKFDKVLGLGLGDVAKVRKEQEVTREVEGLVEKREELRSGGMFEEADELREQIEKRGFVVEDGDGRPRIKPKK